jgi:hypothetical protein
MGVREYASLKPTVRERERVKDMAVQSLFFAWFARLPRRPSLRIFKVLTYRYARLVKLKRCGKMLVMLLLFRFLVEKRRDTSQTRRGR